VAPLKFRLRLATWHIRGMPNKNEPIRIHITRGEQVAIYAPLSKAPAQGRDARKTKAAALTALGLDWVKETSEDAVETVDTRQLLAIYDARVAAGNSARDAMNAVVAQLAQVLARDPFARQRRERIVASLTPSQIEWALGALDKADPSGIADLEIAAVESRLSRAERGSYELPADLAAPAPLTVEVVNADADVHSA